MANTSGARTSSSVLAFSGKALVERLLFLSDLSVVQKWQEKLASGQYLEALIASRLLSKKFRKSPLDAAIAARVTQVADHVRRTGRPLRLLIPFGGYKSPCSWEHPGVGWAEVFAVAGICELVAPICAFHTPGVILEFSSDEAIIPRLTGAGQAVLRHYRDGFDQVVRLVGRYQRDNLTIQQTFIRDAYDADELVRSVEELGRRLESKWFPALPSDEQDRLLRIAAHNQFQPAAGHRDMGGAGLRRSVCEHQAYLEIDNRRRKESFFESCTIPIALRRGIPDWLHLGSNRRSATQFWIGCGVVDLAASSPAAHILPPGRAAAIRPQVEYVPINSTGIDGLDRLPVVLGIS
jgi:hypothetical protein